MLGGAGTGGRSGPYRLYAWSNGPRLAGLLGYPLVVEPRLSTAAQTSAWSVAFAVYVLLVAWCARYEWRMPASERPPAETAPSDSPTARARLTWLALAATGSTLLLAATNQMCQEIAVVPLLWVLPLGLYLGTYLLCFASDRAYARSWCLPILVFALAVMAQATALGARAGVTFGVAANSLGLFVCCLFCHGELAARRPPRGTRRPLRAHRARRRARRRLREACSRRSLPRLRRDVRRTLACGGLATAFVLRDPAYRRRGAARGIPVVAPLFVVVLLIAVLLGQRVLARARPEPHRAARLPRDAAHRGAGGARG